MDAIRPHPLKFHSGYNDFWSVDQNKCRSGFESLTFVSLIVTYVNKGVTKLWRRITIRKPSE